MKIGVIDYEAGNLKSIETALKYLKSNFIISNEPAELSRCGKILFPGVGEAQSAMKVLTATGLGKFLKSCFLSEVPIFGICLGCQIVLDFSEERNTSCLGLVAGKTVRFPQNTGFKIPHMGWNQVEIKRHHYIFNNVSEGSSFYFVHSYYPVPRYSDDILAETDYNGAFCSAFQRNNLVAVQFHPEKSGEAGLTMLKNFITY